MQDMFWREVVTTKSIEGGARHQGRWSHDRCPGREEDRQSRIQPNARCGGPILVG
jgi:hypothetical protein